MNPGARAWAALAALGGLAAVLLGALGSHAFEVVDPHRFDLAWRFQAFHVVVMLIAALTMRMTAWSHLALASFALGALLFCGTLYRASLLPEASTALAPVGGGLFMAGWLLLFIAVLRTRPAE